MFRAPVGSYCPAANLWSRPVTRFERAISSGVDLSRLSRYCGRAERGDAHVRSRPRCRQPDPARSRDRPGFFVRPSPWYTPLGLAAGRLRRGALGFNRSGRAGHRLHAAPKQDMAQELIRGHARDRQLLPLLIRRDRRSRRAYLSYSI